MALPIFQRTVVKDNGDIIPNAQVEVRLESDNSLATLYSDRAGTVSLSNPFNADSAGLALFYANPDEYKITATGNGSTVTWRYVVLEGTAALSDVTTSPTDTTADRLLKVGDFGVGFGGDSNYRQGYLLESIGGASNTAQCIILGRFDADFSVSITYTSSDTSTSNFNNRSRYSGQIFIEHLANNENPSASILTTNSGIFAQQVQNGEVLKATKDGIDYVVLKVQHLTAYQGGGNPIVTGVASNWEPIKHAYLSYFDLSSELTVQSTNNSVLKLDKQGIYHTGNILGTVSATGTYPNLVPTGAIMESGSNANGDYVKYADGTMICTRTRSGGDITTASGSIFVSSSDLIWNFPASFSSTPTVSGGRFSGGSDIIGLFIVSGSTGANPPTGSSATYRLALGYSRSGSPLHDVLAIGRWK